MPAPPPESEPATINTRPFIATTRTSFGGPHRRFDVLSALRRSEDRCADVVNDAGQQFFVPALRHDPDDRLGPRIADHQPPLRTEPRFCGGDRPLDAGRFEGPAVAETHIAQ